MFRILGLMALLMALPGLAQEVSSVRQSQYEWQCETSDGLLVSGHTRQDKAFQSCYNKALETGDEYIVRGGRFKVTAIGTEPGPDPDPTASLTLRWTNPTKNVDGTDIPPGALTLTRLYMTAPEPRTALGDVSAATTSFVVDDLAPGQEYCFVARAKTDVASADSNEACATP